MRRERVEELGGGRETDLTDIHEELTCASEAFCHIAGAIEVRVVNQALPSDGCSGFFEVDAHDDHDVFADFVGEFDESFGVFASRGFVVDGAWSGDDEQPVVFTGDDVGYLLARSKDEVFDIF